MIKPNVRGESETYNFSNYVYTPKINYKGYLHGYCNSNYSAGVDDFTVTMSMVTFNSGDASGSTKCFTIEMTDDTVLEVDENFIVILSVSGESVGSAIVTIEDNDGRYMLYLW